MGRIYWLASYPKSGNTWMRVFLANLLADSDQPVSINDLTKYSFNVASAGLYERFSDRCPADFSYEELAPIRPRVHRWIANNHAGNIYLKTHSFLGTSCNVPMITPDVTAGAIYIVRNPLDVCLSFSRFGELSVDEIIAMMGDDNAASRIRGKDTNSSLILEPIRSWSINVMSWTGDRQPEILVLRYEDLLEKTFDTFKAVTRFLKLDAADTAIRRSIEFCDIGELRRQEETRGFIEKPPSVERFFGSGKRGEWKSKLTELQIKQIVDSHREQMERFSYIPEGL